MWEIVFLARYKVYTFIEYGNLVYDPSNNKSILRLLSTHIRLNNNLFTFRWTKIKKKNKNKNTLKKSMIVSEKVQR